MDNNNSFKYNYSANEQEEIRKIREKYMPKTENKMEQLRRMDESVTRKATVVSLVVGIISCLVFGGGMSILMVIGMDWLIPGLILGFTGIVGMSITYPLYLRIVKNERERIAPEILKLTEELMK